MAGDLALEQEVVPQLLCVLVGEFCAGQGGHERLGRLADGCAGLIHDGAVGLGAEVLAGGDLAAGAAHDALVEVGAAPVGPGGLEGGVLVALARLRLELGEGLLGGDDGLAAAFAHGGHEEVHHGAALFVQVEAGSKHGALSGPALGPGAGLVEELPVAGVVGVVEAARGLHPLGGDHAQDLEG